MSILRSKYKVRRWDEEDHENQRYVEMRAAAAAKLNEFHSHDAGGGSEYVTVGELKIRFADHENISAYSHKPDYNIVKLELTKEELSAIIARITYPYLCKKTVLAMHLGLTVPKLNKLLTDDCYENVCENPEAYPNTFTQYVRVERALQKATEAGMMDRIPIMQERWTAEDYNGKY